MFVRLSSGISVRGISVVLLPQSFLIGVSFRRIEFLHALTLRMLVRLREHSG